MPLRTRTQIAPFIVKAAQGSPIKRLPRQPAGSVAQRGRARFERTQVWRLAIEYLVHRGNDDPRVDRAACRFESEVQIHRVVNRSEEHTSELQSPCNLVCRLLLEKKKPEHTTLPQPNTISR